MERIPEPTEIELSVVKDRISQWSQLREYYVMAEELKSQGKVEITLPIDVFLLAKDIPKSIEMFYKSLFVKAHTKTNS